MADTAMDVHEQGESKAKEKSEQAKKNKKKSKQVVHKDTNAAIKKGLARFQAADQDGDQ
jgi:F0F1-type ATP synthase epsilon subunit